MKRFKFPGMTEGEWMVTTGEHQSVISTKRGITAIVYPAADARAMAALPDILARLALLEKVREAAEELANVVDGYDEFTKRVLEAIAACDEVKP